MSATLTERLLRSLKARAAVHAGDRVGVGVSGGADSVALLLLLEELRERLGIVLSVVHFNHQLRGKQADADEKFVAKLAAARGLAFHAGRANVAAQAKEVRANVEETARRLRYEYFRRLVREGIVGKVAVAHTADDQAETVLGHLLRGTGLPGLGGIHPVAEGATVIRPLLEIRRAELREYLKARRQKWREDVTNRDQARFRARIRRRLLPLLEKQFQPAVVPHLVKLAELAREDEAFLDALLRERSHTLVERGEGQARIRRANLLQPLRNEALATGGVEDAERENRVVAMSKRLVRRIVEELKTRPGQLAAGHVEAVLELARQGQSGKSLSLPGGVLVRRELDALLFLTEPAPSRVGSGKSRKGFSGNNAGQRNVYEYRVALGTEGAAVRVGALGCVFRFRVIDWPGQRRETKDSAETLDRNRLQDPLVLRNWRPGDAYRPAGRHRVHKLKRLLLEKRLSRWEREGWPVLTSAGTVVWARGLPVAAEVAPDAETRSAMVIAEERD